jgi:ADP-heptose:LPS heptosyltransferase
MLDAPLPMLARLWVAETFGITDASPYIAPAERPEAGDKPVITVSLGVGENPAKRIADPFETNLLRGLVSDDAVVVIDKGAGGEETRRVEKAISDSGATPVRTRTWDGSFAGFASLIARSRLYVGYDSAGQHVAAACGVPLVTVFAGFASSRMYERWKPSGRGPIHVVRVEQPDPGKVLVETLSAIYRI